MSSLSEDEMSAIIRRMQEAAAKCDGLDPQAIASWAAFLPTVRVGGALPVTFRPDGDHVLVEVIVPFVPPPPQASTDPNKIPLRIAEGFPVPLTARHKLPAYSPINAPASAANFLRHIVREIYRHEIDEQFHVDGQRPFAPEHLTDEGNT